MNKKNYELGNAEKSKLFLIKEQNKYDYKLEEFKFDKNRKNDSHVSIINLVQEKSTVLDIGCATGLIANILVNEKQCIVDGIEYDVEAFTICKKSKIFRNVFNFSITDKENKNFAILKKNKYDYIILADILEHLINPWDALISIYDLLKEDGQIIISLPNVAHIDIIKGLINGKFNYNNLGLLDTTHLRFFTFNSFCDMISNIATSVNVFYNVECKNRIISIPPYVTNAEDYSLYNLNDYLEEYFVLQNIIVLTKSNDQKVHIKGEKNINTNLFEKMLDTFKNKKEENTELNEKITYMKKENETINNKLYKTQQELHESQQELLEKKQELNEIYNSKRWKFINKICDLLIIKKKK